MTSAPPPHAYGHYPAWQPPPGWRPPPPPSTGGASLATAIVCGILAIPALLVTLASGHDTAVCNSGLGLFGQVVNSITAHRCKAANGVHILAVVALVVLVAGCLIATLTHLLGRRPQVPPGWPGWQGAMPPPTYPPPYGQPGPQPAPPPGYH